jgi:hypothetical protein
MNEGYASSLDLEGWYAVYSVFCESLQVRLIASAADGKQAKANGSCDEQIDHCASLS